MALAYKIRLSRKEIAMFSFVLKIEVDEIESSE